MAAVFTLETDYPPEKGYRLDNSRETDYTSQFEKWNGLNFGWTIHLTCMDYIDYMVGGLPT